MEDIYISTDIEADGPIPGPHSMYSLGSVALTHDGTLISSFAVNLEELDGATGHPDNMKWWTSHAEALEVCRANQQPIAESMKKYVDWLESLGGNLIFVGYPVTYDFMFVYWYVMKFVGRSPFGYSGIDIKSYSMAVQKAASYKNAGKDFMPKEWLPAESHTHIALDDAFEQGLLFCNMLKANTPA